MSSVPTVSASEVQRVAEVVSDRLRHLAPARLEPIEAEVGLLVDDLAVLARRAEGLGPAPLPTVSARALGDVVSVLAHDIVAASGAPGSSAATSLAQAHTLLVAMRRLLP